VTDVTNGAHRSVGAGVKRVRRLLLCAQVALSIVLLTGAGLMVRSYVNVRHVDLGFVPDHVVALDAASRSGSHVKKSLLTDSLPMGNTLW
jgi:hypothetical protein